MSAAFDDAMIKEVATVISTEARAFNNAGRAGLDYFTPNINRQSPLVRISFSTDRTSP
jgi:beta-D-xylosidase 4